MTAELVVVKGKDRGASLSLATEGVRTIGRADGQDLRLKGDKKVSTSHAKVIVKGGGFLIEDLGSTNGTFVNGERVHSAPLKSGDQVKIGHTLLVFKTDAGSVHLSDLEHGKDSTDGTATPPPEHAKGKGKKSTEGVKRSRSGIRQSVAALEETLFGIGDALSETKDLRGQIDGLVRVVLQATGAARAILFVRDADSGALTAATAIGRDGARENAPVDADVLRDAVAGQLAGPSGDAAAVAAPLRAGERTIGALYVDDPEGRTPQPREARLLATCASVIGLALRGDRLEHLAESAVEVVGLAQRPLNRTAIELVPLVEAAARLYGPVAEARGLAFERNFPQGVRILGDEALVARAIDRLVEVALVAAKQTVRLEVQADARVASVIVSRGGTPVPDALAAELVAPDGPAGDLKGALGRLSDGALALVRAAVARSGGRLLVEHALPGLAGQGGTERSGPPLAVSFVLELPVAS